MQKDLSDRNGMNVWNVHVCARVCVCMCVCVCERAREGEVNCLWLLIHLYIVAYYIVYNEVISDSIQSF